MAHSTIGTVSNQLYNTTTDKTLTFNQLLPVGTLVVVYQAGYSNGMPTFNSIADSKGNSWSAEVSALVASGSKWMVIAWSNLTHAIAVGDTVLLDWTAATPQRSFAVARAFSGLNGLDVDIASNYNGFSSNFPAAAAPVSVGPAGGLFTGFVFYPTEYFSADNWSNGIDQKINFFDVANVDTFSIGELSMPASSSVVPQHDLGLSSQWIIIGLAFGDGGPGGGAATRARLVMF